jgi:hypothetical protein
MTHANPLDAALAPEADGSVLTDEQQTTVSPRPTEPPLLVQVIPATEELTHVAEFGISGSALSKLVDKGSFAPASNDEVRGTLAVHPDRLQLLTGNDAVTVRAEVELDPSTTTAPVAGLAFGIDLAGLKRLAENSGELRVRADLDEGCMTVRFRPPFQHPKDKTPWVIRHEIVPCSLPPELPGEQDAQDDLGPVNTKGLSGALRLCRAAAGTSGRHPIVQIEDGLVCGGHPTASMVVRVAGLGGLTLRLRTKDAGKVARIFRSISGDARAYKTDEFVLIIAEGVFLSIRREKGWLPPYPRLLATPVRVETTIRSEEFIKITRYCELDVLRPAPARGDPGSAGGSATAVDPGPPRHRGDRGRCLADQEPRRDPLVRLRRRHARGGALVRGPHRHVRGGARACRQPRPGLGHGRRRHRPARRSDVRPLTDPAAVARTARLVGQADWGGNDPRLRVERYTLQRQRGRLIMKFGHLRAASRSTQDSAGCVSAVTARRSWKIEAGSRNVEHRHGKQA